MALDLSKLNKEQKEAVVHGNGPLLIVAGAGTGKTTVITQRVVHLIEQGKAKPEEILAVTFTDKAANEMEERVDKMLSMGYVDLWVSTFHSFCERVLRDHALDIGLPADFKIMDQTSAWLLMRRNLDKLELDYYKPLGNPTKFVQALIAHFSHCKDQGVYPEDYLKHAEELKTSLTDLPEDSETERVKEVANAYHAYQRLLLENSALDFGDMISYCLKLFQKRPLILKKYREKFKYILVDEFQDTNWAQYELIKLVSAPDNNLTVCADDDQAIYRWRGASFNNIIQFKKDFPKAKEVSLIKNYRSSQNILDLAYKFIKQNDPDRLEHVSKINKKLVSNLKEKGEIKHINSASLEEEVQNVIEKIAGILKKDKDVGYNDIAILVRANNAAVPFVRALERAGLPYQFLASSGLYSKPVILDIISYFKLLDDCYDGVSSFRILNIPYFKISSDDVMKISQYARRKAKSLFEALQELPLIYGLSQDSVKKINFILAMIKKHVALAKERPVSEVLIAFLNDSGYLKYLTSKENKESFDLLNQFYKRVKTFEESSMDPSLRNFMEELNLELESGEQGKLEFDPEQGPDMIKVMTIHGAKGLEFKYVFIVNLVNKRFPTMERKELIELPEDLIKDIKPEGDVHLQEERRIFYVGMTRAKKALYFTSARNYGGKEIKKLSRFLVELDYKDNEPVKVKNGLEAKPPVLKKQNKESYIFPAYFSYSQLAAYEKCPLQYKFAHILKVPVRGKAVFSFGKTMHNTLYEFLMMVLKGSGSDQKDLFGEKKKGFKFPSLEDLISLYEKNWIDDWYENEKQKEDYRKKGKEVLKDVYKDLSDNPPKVLMVEGNPALEIPFNLKLGGETIYGVIDRIDEADKGVSVIDYKTGKVKERLDFDDKKQLAIYQMAVEEVFKKKPEKMVYNYLEGGKNLSFLLSDKEKAAHKEKIVEQMKRIKEGIFNPTPGWQCSYCDFKDICDHAQR